MTDRTIVLSTNGRHSLRGIRSISPREFEAIHLDNDALTYTIDYSQYLDGGTISSVTRTSNGLTVANTSNTTTKVIQRLSDYGYVDITVTTSTGDTDQLRLNIKPRDAFIFPNDYRYW